MATPVEAAAAHGNGRVAEPISSSLGAVEQVIYPPLCLVCDSDIDQPGADFCPACLGELVAVDEPTCPHCAASVGPYANTAAGCLECHRQGHRFDTALRLGMYTGKLRQTCLAFKSSSNELLGAALARLLLKNQGDSLRAMKPTLVVAVPLHFLRRFRRGFNQAESLAAHLAAGLKVPHRSRILRRVRRTLPQSGLKRDERLANVRGAFQARRVDALQDATVLLVDDILTTGATCSEAARALKAVGAARVVVVMVARSQEHVGAKPVF